MPTPQSIHGAYHLRHSRGRHKVRSRRVHLSERHDNLRQHMILPSLPLWLSHACRCYYMHEQHDQRPHSMQQAVHTRGRLSWNSLSCRDALNNSYLSFYLFLILFLVRIFFVFPRDLAAGGGIETTTKKNKRHNRRVETQCRSRDDHVNSPRW